MMRASASTEAPLAVPPSGRSGSARASVGNDRSNRWASAPTALGTDVVLRRPVVDGGPVEVVEERVDVRGSIGAVVEEVGVLVDVECDQRRRVPDRIRVLHVADVVEQAALVPVIRG